MALDTFLVLLKTTELQKEQNPSGYSHLSWLTILLTTIFLIMLLTSNISTWKLSKGSRWLRQNIVEVANASLWWRTRSRCKNKASKQILFYSYIQLLWCCFFLMHHHSRDSAKFSVYFPHFVPAPVCPSMGLWDMQSTMHMTAEENVIDGAILQKRESERQWTNV